MKRGILTGSPANRHRDSPRQAARSVAYTGGVQQGISQTSIEQQDYGMKRQEVLDRKCTYQGLASGGGFQGFRPWAAAALALTLTACASTPEPRIITRTVEVPVSVPCAVKVEEPAYVDTDEAIAGAPNVFELAKLYAAGRLQRLAALGEYRAAVSGCAKP